MVWTLVEALMLVHMVLHMCRTTKRLAELNTLWFCTCDSCDVCLSHVRRMGQIHNDTDVLSSINPITGVVIPHCSVVDTRGQKS